MSLVPRFLQRRRILFLFVVISVLLVGYWHLDNAPHRIDPESTAPHIISALTGQTSGLSEASHSSLRYGFCKQHGWEPFKPKSPGTKRKVFDLFMVNDELDWMEIRLNTTYDYVDYFVVVEASRTFTNHPKPLVIKKNWELFEPYQKKIIYHELEYPKDWTPPRAWDAEDLQRNAMFEQVFPKLEGEQKPNYGDVIVVADVDEISRPETLIVLRTCDYPRRLSLRSRFYYYSFQFLHRGKEWAHPEATFYQGSKTILPTNLRNNDGGFKPLIWLEKGQLWNSGWHCSSCFKTMDQLLNKMASFSHTSYNQAVYRDRKHIADRVRNGKDLWDRVGQYYDRIDNNQDMPQFLLDNPERFRYLVNRDGKTAGFSDYP